jgi:hypothetical protein
LREIELVFFLMALRTISTVGASPKPVQPFPGDHRADQHDAQKKDGKPVFVTIHGNVSYREKFDL